MPPLPSLRTIYLVLLAIVVSIIIARIEGLASPRCLPKTMLGGLISKLACNSPNHCCAEPGENYTTTIHDLRKRFKEKFTSLERNIDGQVTSLERITNEKITSLEKNMNEQVTHLEKSTDKQITSLKRTIDEQAASIERLKSIIDLNQTIPNDIISDRPVIGSFHTSEIRRMDTSWRHTSKMVPFRMPYPQRPGIPVALTMLDIGNSQTIRVTCYSSNIEETYFEMNIDTWDKTQLHQASCSWLELSQNHHDFQYGSYDTLEDHGTGQYPKENIRRINFSRRYEETPVVVVWLTKLDMRRDRNWVVEAFATDISTTGFTLHIDTFGDTELYSGAASWVSYTPGTPGVVSGTLHTPSDSRYAEFDKNAFILRPRTILGISSFNIEHDRDLRLMVGTKSVNASGMMWFLESWGGTIVHSASASYIALD